MNVLRCSLVATLALLACHASRVEAQAPPTVINQVPYYISTSGNYVLGGNLSYTSASGAAIIVSTSNVQIDFNGYFISNRAAGPSTGATGVSLNGVNNVTITNGTLAAFYTGIYANEVGNQTTENYGHVIDRMHLISETYAGITLYNSHSSCIIQNCQISGIGTVGSSSAYGIVVNSPGATTEIRGNSVAGVTATNGYGIYVANGAGFLQDNHVSNTTLGIGMNSQCKYLNNLTSGCTTPFNGGVAVGPNN